jgi:putative membrane protein
MPHIGLKDNKKDDFPKQGAAFLRYFFRRVLLGLIVSVAFITPGLSGGVIAAAIGLYEPMLHAITHLHRQFRRSFIFLCPLGVGAVIGILSFGNLMRYLMAVAPTTVIFAFVGLVAGSMPTLIGEANAGGFRRGYLLISAAAFALILFIESMMVRVLPPTGMELDTIGSLISGAVIAVGTVIPGVSSSFLLMQLGVYERLLEVLTGFNIPIIALMGVGGAVTALALVFGADRLFKRFRGPAYYAVIGFLMGSVVAVFPGFAQGWKLALDVFLFALSAVGCWFLMSIAPKGRKLSA